MRYVYVLAVLMMCCMSLQAGTGCNQAIPSGTGCIHGHAWGPSRNYGPVNLCADWDTTCSAPLQTIYYFHNAGSYYDWEFLDDAGVSYNVKMEDSFYFYWSPGGTQATPTLGSQQTYFMTHYSYCTDAGWYYLGGSTCSS